jgi:hypothetical protein
MHLRKLLFLAAAAAISLPVGIASAAKLVDGLYDCTIGTAFLGSIRIDGAMFSGPAYDGKFKDSYPFDASDGQTIIWGGPVGGITDYGKIVSTVLTDVGKGRVGFDITIQNPRGNFQTINCAPQ